MKYRRLKHREGKPGLTQKQLAKAAGIKLSNLQRREDGTNEFTVSELERVAAAIEVTASELVEEALADYGGIDKLIREYADERENATGTSEAPDNVTPLTRKQTEEIDYEALNNDKAAHGRDAEQESDESDPT